MSAVQWFVENPIDRQVMGAKAYDYYLHTFNWREVSKPLYNKMDELMQNTSAGSIKIYPFTYGLPAPLYKLNSKGPHICKWLCEKLPKKINKRMLRLNEKIKKYNKKAKKFTRKLSI